MHACMCARVYVSQCQYVCTCVRVCVCFSSPCSASAAEEVWWNHFIQCQYTGLKNQKERPVTEVSHQQMPHTESNTTSTAGSQVTVLQQCWFSGHSFTALLVLRSQFYSTAGSQVTVLQHCWFSGHSFTAVLVLRSQFYSTAGSQVTVLQHCWFSGHSFTALLVLRSQFYSSAGSQVTVLQQHD